MKSMKIIGMLGILLFACAHPLIAQDKTFDCHFNLADGPQSLVIKPDTSFSGHKKTEIELQTVRCIANCGTIAQ